jgi:sulfite exporter TauE/SafE
MNALDAMVFDPIALIPAFLTGLLGSTHCAAMCAAPMAAVTSAPSLAGIPVTVADRGFAAAFVPAHASAQAGRIMSYALAGGIAGGAAATMGGAWNPQSVQAAGLLFAFLAQGVLLLTGLYIAGWTGALAWLERAVQPIWRRLQSLTRHVIPVRNPASAFAFGALWGWVPCGLSWSMLVVALASGSAWTGATTMLAFGLGTLPVMLGAGSAAAWLTPKLRDARWRMAAGFLVIALALTGMTRIAGSGPGLASALRTCLPGSWGGM